MGRGRAKAKQTKVARELKYRSVDTDFIVAWSASSGDRDGPRHPSGLRGRGRRRVTRISPRAAATTTHDGDGDYSDLRKSG